MSNINVEVVPEELPGFIEVNVSDRGADGDPATNPVTSVAGKQGAVTLVKADVGLSEVDDTSDVNKPISDDTQDALDDKHPLVDQDLNVADSPTFNEITTSGDATLEGILHVGDVMTFVTLDNSTPANPTLDFYSGGIKKGSFKVNGDDLFFINRSSGAAANIFFNVLSGTALTATGNKDIGIGTTTPDEKLHVVGDTKLEGVLVIHQQADSLGFQINGFDNVSGEKLLVNLDSSGYANVDATRGFRLKHAGENVAFISKSTSDGLRLYNSVPVSFGSTQSTRYGIRKDDASGKLELKYNGMAQFVITFDQPNKAIETDCDVEITDTTKGIILTSPDAARWRVTVDNSGNLTSTSI